jgi:hypothetical protein
MGYTSWKYRLTLVGRFAAFAVIAFALFGVGLLAMLNQRLGLSYAKDIATLSALQERLPVILLVAGLSHMVAIAAAGFVLLLLWTHAVSGPLVRARRYLQLMASERDIADVQFRKTDQLHRLASAFQQWIAARRIKRAAWDVLLERAERLIQECEQWNTQHPGDPSGSQEYLRNLAGVYEQMRHLLRGNASGQKG